MKKIVLMSQGKHKDHLLVEMLSLLFPECEIHFSEPPGEILGLSLEPISKRFKSTTPAKADVQKRSENIR